MDKIIRSVAWASVTAILVYVAFAGYAVFSKPGVAVGLGVFVRILYTPLFWIVAIASMVVAYFFSAKILL